MNAVNSISTVYPYTYRAQQPVGPSGLPQGVPDAKTVNPTVTAAPSPPPQPEPEANTAAPSSPTPEVLAPVPDAPAPAGGRRLSRRLMQDGGAGSVCPKDHMTVTASIDECNGECSVSAAKVLSTARQGRCCDSSSSSSKWCGELCRASCCQG